MSNERNLVMVRIANPEKEPVQAWLAANSDRNAFDPAVLDYPPEVMQILASHTNGTTHSYMPMQLVAVLESIGVNPESKPLDVATGIMESVKSAVVMAQAAKVKEMYFLGSDESTAEGAKRLGFTELPYKVYRRRI